MIVVEYEASWQVTADQLLETLRSVLGGWDRSRVFLYEHIGSTAVPGLAAKPIVDLQVCMPDLPSMEELGLTLASAGFEPAAGARADSPGVYCDTPRRDGLDLAAHAKRLLHLSNPPAILHVRRLDSPFAEFVVLLRDWLRANPDEADRYGAYKKMLAAEHSNDPDYDDYTRAKSTYFDDIEPRMRGWAVDTGWCR